MRLARSADAQQWAERIHRGLVRITMLTRLEVGFSTRSGRDIRDGRSQPPLASMPVEYLTPAVERCAEGVQTRLAERGQHRGPSVPDLLIAAAAELADATVLHIDDDFDLIAEITGQSVERLASG